MIDRDTASRLGISTQAIDDTLYDAFGQRQVSTMFTQLNQYHVVMEVEPHFQTDPRRCEDLYVKSQYGTQVPLRLVTHLDSASRRWRSGTRASFPRTRGQLQPGARQGLGDAVDAVHRVEQRINMPPSINCEFPGNRGGFSDFAFQRASADSGRAGHRLHCARRALRELHPPHHHPLHAAFGRRGRTAGAVLITATISASIALIGIILLIGIVKKNAIMMIDFALDASAWSKAARKMPSTRPACCASGRS